MITQNYKEINDVCKLHDIIENYNFEIKILREQIKNLTDKIYGRKTEKISLDPMYIPSQKYTTSCNFVIACYFGDGHRQNRLLLVRYKDYKSVMENCYKVSLVSKFFQLNCFSYTYNSLR